MRTGEIRSALWTPAALHSKATISFNVRFESKLLILECLTLEAATVNNYISIPSTPAADLSEQELSQRIDKYKHPRTDETVSGAIQYMERYVQQLRKEEEERRKEREKERRHRDIAHLLRRAEEERRKRERWAQEKALLEELARMQARTERDLRRRLEQRDREMKMHLLTAVMHALQKKEQQKQKRIQQAGALDSRRQRESSVCPCVVM